MIIEYSIRTKLKNPSTKEDVRLAIMNLIAELSEIINPDRLFSEEILKIEIVRDYSSSEMVLFYREEK